MSEILWRTSRHSRCPAYNTTAYLNTERPAHSKHGTTYRRNDKALGLIYSMILKSESQTISSIIFNIHVIPVQNAE